MNADQTRLHVDTADKAFLTTLDVVLSQGTLLEGDESASIGSEQKSKEILNYTITLTKPIERLLRNPARKLNLPAAIARFVWMMAGSDRLADMAFYESQVRFFSDDGISVPGSNYGQRLLQPRPGLNQLEAVIQRLRSDPSSRRAAMSIYHPEDAVRHSRDIPCAFGVFYHVRDNALHATTIMRSNNAFVLFPYNIFEFSLLAEIVSAELKVSLGTLTHFAGSMHVYECDIKSSEKVIRSRDHVDMHALKAMPKMPREGAIEQVRELVRLEAELRHGSAGIGGENIEEWIDKGVNRLENYWRQMYFLLLLHVVRQNQSSGAIESLQSSIESPFKDYLPDDSFEVHSEGTLQRELFQLELSQPATPTVIPLHKTAVHLALRRRTEEWEVEHGEKIPWQVFVKLEEHYASRFAARGDQEDIPGEQFAGLIQDFLGMR